MSEQLGRKNELLLEHLPPVVKPNDPYQPSTELEIIRIMDTEQFGQLLVRVIIDEREEAEVDLWLI